MKFKGLLLTSAVAAASLGLAGCSSSSNDGAQETLNGIVVDGYIDQLRICYDTNLNKVNDDGETCVFSTVDADGIARYSLPLQRGIPLVGEVITGLTRDLDNPGQFIDDPNTAADDGNRFTIQAPAESQLLSPLTTLLQKKIEDSPNTPVAELEAQILADLGVANSGVSLFDDFVALSNSSDANIAAAATATRNIARVVTNILATNLNTARTTAGNPTDNPTIRAIFDVIVEEVATSLAQIATRTQELIDQGNPIETVVVVIDDSNEFDSTVGSDPDALEKAVTQEIKNNIDNNNPPTDDTTGVTGAAG